MTTCRWNNLAASLTAFALLAMGGMEASAATRSEIKRMVIEEAQNSRVPPALAMAVAKVESDFQERALSTAGARGVMQIMPKTARDVFGVDKDELWNARLNIQLGVDYLEQLHDQYGGDWKFVLSHYNGGTLGGDNNGNLVSHGYTRKYVADVLRWRQRYAEQETVWRQFETAAKTDESWKAARTKVRNVELGDNTKQVIARKTESRPSKQEKPWVFSDGDAQNRPWRQAKKLTDWVESSFLKRVNNARRSLDDFGGLKILRRQLRAEW